MEEAKPRVRRGRRPPRGPRAQESDETRAGGEVLLVPGGGLQRADAARTPGECGAPGRRSWPRGSRPQRATRPARRRGRRAPTFGALRSRLNHGQSGGTARERSVLKPRTRRAPSRLPRGIQGRSRRGRAGGALLPGLTTNRDAPGKEPRGTGCPQAPASSVVTGSSARDAAVATGGRAHEARPTASGSRPLARGFALRVTPCLRRRPEG